MGYGTGVTGVNFGQHTKKMESMDSFWYYTPPKVVSKLSAQDIQWSCSPTVPLLALSRCFVEVEENHWKANGTMSGRPCSGAKASWGWIAFGVGAFDRCLKQQAVAPGPSTRRRLRRDDLPPLSESESRQPSKSWKQSRMHFVQLFLQHGSRIIRSLSDVWVRIVVYQYKLQWLGLSWLGIVIILSSCLFIMLVGFGY